jgi:hypothetical protein
METAGRLSGIGPIGIDRRAHRSSLIRHLKLIWQLASLAALAAVALTAPGCSNASSQTAGPVYAGPAEYAAYGYPENPYLAFDPFLYGYYWSVPYYNNGYPGYGGDGDHDCDDGFCAGLTAAGSRRMCRESGFVSGTAAAPGRHGGQPEKHYQRTIRRTGELELVRGGSRDQRLIQRVWRRLP